MDGHVAGELARLSAAEAALGALDATTRQLLDALTGIVDLLEQDTLLDDGPGSLAGDPAVVLVLEPERLDPSAGEARLPLLVATRQGSLIRASLSPDGQQARGSRLEILAEHRIEGFDAARDVVVGLYWTRGATIFHEGRDLLLVARQGRSLRVYETAADAAPPAFEPLRLIGDRAPAWMAVCPVGAPPGHDLLVDSPTAAPPADASGAVSLGGQLYSSLRVRRDGEPYPEAEALHCCGHQVVLVCADQSLVAREARAGKLSPRPAWERTLDRQPLCICPIPAAGWMAPHPLRLLVGHEAGAWSILAVVGRTTVRQVWDGLIGKVGKAEGLTCLGDWISWVLRNLVATATDPPRVSTLLSVLLSQVRTLKEERGELTEEVAKAFRRLLSVDEFLPVLRTMREIMQDWPVRREPLLAEAMEKVYRQLPYQLQDLVDIELQGLPVRLTKGRGAPAAAPRDAAGDADLAAYRELLRHRAVNRARLLAKDDIPESARLAVLAEEWLDSYVLESARSTRQPEPLRLRSLPPDQCLVLHRASLSLLDTASWEGRDATPRQWIHASRGAFTVRDPGGLTALAVASERVVRLFSFPAAGGSPELLADYQLPVGMEIVKAADADQGRLLLIVAPVAASSGEELWLVSYERGELVAHRELACRRPLHWALQPLAGGKRWLLAADVAEDEIGLFEVALGAGGGLELRERARYRVRGRVRSLRMAAGTGGAARRGAILWVGTTAGYVFALRCQVDHPSLAVEWIYCIPGAVRHISHTRHDGGNRIVVVSATGEARVLGAMGECLWQRRLSRPLRSASFAQRGERRFVVLLDTQGFFHAYRETAADDAWKAVQASIARIGEGKDTGTARWEMAHALRLVSGTAATIPVEVLGLKTPSARACVVRRFGELLAAESESALASPVAGLLEGLGPSELLPLARLRIEHLPLPTRRRTVTALLHALAFRAIGVEDRSISDRQPAVELLAELARSVGAGALVPEALATPELNSWWQIPQVLRDDPWVIVSLLCGRVAAAGTPPDLADLVASAAWIGPAGFEALPLVVPCEQQGASEVLRLAIRSLGAPGPATPDPGLHAMLGEVQLQGPAANFVRLLRFLCAPAGDWDEFLRVISESSTGSDAGRRAALPPELHALLAWTQVWPRPDRRQLVYAPVDHQLNAIDQLAADELALPAAASPASPASQRWEAWIRCCGARFVDARRHQLEARRKLLRGLLWVRLEQLRVERLTGSLVHLRATLVREGRERSSPAVFRLEVEQGMRLLDLPAATTWKWSEVPPEISWLGSLDRPDQESIKLVATTRIEGEDYSHALGWHAEVPRLEQSPVEPLLVRLPGVCDRLLEAVLAERRSGLHVLALDPELGIQTVSSKLLQATGTLWQQLDETLLNLGPGRTLPAGLNAEAVLRAMGADHTASTWRVRRRGSYRRVLLHPAEETMTRLFLPSLSAVFEGVKQALERLEGLPTFLLLPTELAARLHGNLAGKVWYHSLNVLPAVTAEPDAASQELEAWTAQSARLEREEARNALAALGSHLPLVTAWVAMGERRPSPRQFLASAASERLLEKELAALDPLQLGDLVLAARARARKRVRDLEPGMVSDQEILSTVRRGRAKQLVVAGQTLTQKVIDDLRSDPGHPQELLVRGYPSEGGNALVDGDLAALERIVSRRPEEVRRSHQRLAQRRLVQLAGGIGHAVPPYLPWLEERLAIESSGRQLMEDVLGKHLLYELTFGELAAAGDGLTRLCPTLGKEALGLVRELGALYAVDPEPERLRLVLQRLTGCTLQVIPAPAQGRFDKLHEELTTIFAGQGSLFCAERPEIESHHILGFLTAAGALDPVRLRDILRRSPEAVMTLLGPAAGGLGWADSEQLCVLGDPELKDALAAAAAEIHSAFWRAVRNRVGLKHFSPFQVGNYLDVDSPVFVGRERETRRILSGIATTSFLIVGARQIGKTSLLRHIYGKLKKEQGRTALFIECAGTGRSGRLRAKLGKQVAVPDQKTEPDHLAAIETALRALPSPVLLLNEVDGLCQAHDLLQQLRSLSEQRVCQVVMTGYHTALMSLQQPSHPFFHWVQGETGEKAFVLGPLTDLAARELINRLHDSDLALAWENDEVRDLCYNVLLGRSYRIPMLLQQGCQNLVNRLGTERRQLIRRHDLEAEAGLAENLAWKHLQFIRADPKDHEATHWGDLLLAALVNQLYYRGGSPAIRDPRLREKPVADFSFTAAEAKLALQHALQRAALSAAERADLDRRFPGESYERFLEQMSLTIIVSPLAGGHRQYYFTEFIFPIELDRYLVRSKRNIDDHLLELVADLNYMRRQKARNT